jgi:hypothetical protein
VQVPPFAAAETPCAAAGSCTPTVTPVASNGRRFDTV